MYCQEPVGNGEGASSMNSVVDVLRITKRIGCKPAVVDGVSIKYFDDPEPKSKMCWLVAPPSPLPHASAVTAEADDSGDVGSVATEEVVANTPPCAPPNGPEAPSVIELTDASRVPAESCRLV